MKKPSFFLIVLLLLSVIPIIESTYAQEENNGNITFQPSIIPQVSFTYDKFNHWFELSYEQYFMRFKPFAIVNGDIWTQKRMVNYLLNKGATYQEIIQTFKNIIHWGFNISGIPVEDQSKIDYLGFKLVDYNFPLKNIEIEEVDAINYTFTRFSIPKINLEYDFSDLQEQGYTVDIVNKTYVLIGNVKNKEDLLIDPITYSSPLMYVVGYPEGSPASFWDCWNASYVNGWNAIFKSGWGQYDMNCTLRIGNTSYIETWFVAKQEVVQFPDGIITGSWQYMIYLYSNSHFHLGDRAYYFPPYSGFKTGRLGCVIVNQDRTYHHNTLYGQTSVEPYPDVQLYGSFIFKNYTGTHGTIRYCGRGDQPSVMYSVMLKGVGIIGCYGDFNEVYSVNSYDWGMNANDGNFTNIIIQGAGASIRASIGIGGSAWYYNVSLLDCNYFDMNGVYGNATLVDSVQGGQYAWRVRYSPKYWDNVTFNRAYTFNLNVTEEDGTPIQDAEIRLYRNATGDSYEELVFEVNTPSNGSINEVVMMAMNNGTTGATNYGTWTYFNPFRLEIRHDDYYLYNSTFVLDSRVDWELSLTSLYVTLTSTVNVEGTDLTPLVIFFVCGLCIALSLIGFIVPFMSFLALILSLFILIPIPLSSVAYLLALQVGTILFCSATLITVLLRRNAEISEEERNRLPAYRRR